MKLDDLIVLVRSFITGLISLFRLSTWRWMKDTKEEHNMSWSKVIGIILYGDYRLKKHYDRTDYEDW